MTIPELINHLLGQIQRKFYADRVREFKRDERALMKAILTYGKHCHERGWDFKPEAILQDIATVLNEILRSRVLVKHLPVYLEGAIKRHIGQRSEELQASARKCAGASATKLLQTTAGVVAVIEKTTVATMNDLLREVKATQKRHAAQVISQKPKQKELL